jgi:hypothetical protein
MKAVAIILVVVVLMVFFGWLTFTSIGGNPSVTLNTEQVREDTGEAAEATKQAAGTAAVKTREAVDEIRRTDVDVDVDVDRNQDGER